MILAAHLGHHDARAQMYDAASTILAQKLSQVKGVGQVIVGGSSLPAVRVELNPGAEQLRHRAGGCPHRARTPPTPIGPKGSSSDGERGPGRSTPTTSCIKAERVPAADRRLAERRAGAPLGRRRRAGLRRGPAQRRARERQAGGAHDHLPAARREHHRDRRSRPRACCRSCEASIPPRSSVAVVASTERRRSAPRCTTSR